MRVSGLDDRPIVRQAEYHDLDVSIPRYRISTLDVEGRIVWFTVGDQEALGFLRYTNAGKPRYRLRLGPTHSEDLPKFMWPSLWRPIKPEAWPEPLPEPAWPDRTPKREQGTSSIGEARSEGGTGWPYADIRLGQPGEAPETEKECEARFLRMLRTAHVLNREVRRSGSAWPPALIVEARLIEKRLRSSKTGTLPWLSSSDYDDFHIDRSELNARAELWLPTRRDIGDYEAGINKWLPAADVDAWLLFGLRAANPQFSWRQIAEREGMTVEDIHERYDAAVSRLFRNASQNRDMPSALNRTGDRRNDCR